MKVVILAGGYGTRISEETSVRPKPMVEIGGKPILWHIMHCYAKYGHKDFVILAGYKADFIRNYFLNYHRQNSDFTINTKTGDISWSRSDLEDWNVTVVDTGLDTMTGGRIKRARDVIGEERFLLTYGDGVTDLNVDELIAFHEKSKNLATLTAVTQPGRFGALGLTDDLEKVRAFREKAANDGGLINGGYFVCEPEVYDLIDGDDTVWEQEPVERLVEKGRLGSFHHKGYWQNMDTLRDKHTLETIWASGNAPWKA
ncbi:glucose-1-phosphate cytidylyltransferase [Hirschia litorea]|uniref:Glucose-1-phosphate cytidylyltransferase n=1 Tax=Hirschia litorea TaxID=1199156 RepID=A0ABW2IG80_9PROT